MPFPDGAITPLSFWAFLILGIGPGLVVTQSSDHRRYTMSDNLEKTVENLILVLDGKLLPYIEKLTFIHSQLIETSSLDPEETKQVLSGFDENINPLLIDLRNITNQLTTIKRQNQMAIGEVL
jgi:hypothetical protein